MLLTYNIICICNIYIITFYIIKPKGYNNQSRTYYKTNLKFTIQIILYYCNPSIAKDTPIFLIS